MIKNFLKTFGVLFILLFQFTSCLYEKDDRKPVYFFYDEPAVVHQLGTDPYIRNQSNLFYIPGLTGDANLKENDLLWTSFIVDLEEQDYVDLLSMKTYLAKNLKYDVVDSSKVIIPADAEEFQTYLSDDYSAPIEASVLYRYYIDSLWFFGFVQKDQSNQLGHTYELILNPEIENNSSGYPTLYIRSKQVNTSADNKAHDRYKREVFAFDVADFVNYYRAKTASTGLINFNIKYKTGTDSNGKDIYKEFMSNPISWDFGK